MPRMIPWHQALPEITRRISAPPGLLVALDFDGTLAAIVPHPPDAVLLPGMASVLEMLAAAPGVHLAIVSGRPLADLRPRIPLRDVAWIGSHGMEMQGHGLDGLPAGLQRYTSLLAGLAEELRRSTRFLEGVGIEEKPLGVALHTRQASPTVTAAARSLLERIASRENSLASSREPVLRIQEGHCVAELLPAVAFTKGTSLSLLMDRLRIPGSAVFCAGDDVTDETMFRTLPNAVSVRIGRTTGGSAAESAAAFTAENPADLLDLLRHVAQVRSAPRPV